MMAFVLVWFKAFILSPCLQWAWCLGGVAEQPFRLPFFPCQQTSKVKQRWSGANTCGEKRDHNQSFEQWETLKQGWVLLNFVCGMNFSLVELNFFSIFGWSFFSSKENIPLVNHHWQQGKVRRSASIYSEQNCSRTQCVQCSVGKKKKPPDTWKHKCKWRNVPTLFARMVSWFRERT